MSQMRQALEKAGVTALDRVGGKKQKPGKNGDKRNGREDKALANTRPMKEDPMSDTQTTTTEKSHSNNRVPEVRTEQALTTEQALSSMAQSVHTVVTNWFNRPAGTPVATVATVTPISRVALESIVRYAVASTLLSLGAGIVVKIATRQSTPA